jgi:hypothetical protein
MKTTTKSFVTHRTNVSSDEKRTDGGRGLLIELIDDIREDKRVGKLTANFGSGGSLSALIFEETENIPQRDIEVEPASPVIRYLHKN